MSEKSSTTMESHPAAASDPSGPLIRVARQAKIMGGSEATPGELPHQVALSYNDEFICGGSIISTLLILCAAHCLKYKRPNRLKVIAGLHDQKSVMDNGTLLQHLTGGGYEQIRGARYIYMHENYVWETDINDIAIIVLSQPLQFTSHVKAISLPEEGEDFVGYAVVSGWGRTEEKGVTSDILRKVKVPIVPLEECRRRYRKMRYKITDNMLCAGESGRDSCQGDSGGPLVCRRNDSTPVQCGVISFGHGCGRPGFPGIYTRIANYIDWIEQTKKKITARGKCRTDHFYCSSGPGCIPRAFLCDLEADCREDDEDERGCIYMTSCRRGQFRCNNGRCIKKEYTCDFMDDCGDRSDEDKCPSENKLCSGGQHQCGSGGRCIPEEWKCDGEVDCDDDSDEEGCPSAHDDSENEIIPTETPITTTTASPCTSEQFYCSRDYRCIPLRWRCDRDRDCRSGQDEIGCKDDDVDGDNSSNSIPRNNGSTTTSSPPPIINLSTTTGRPTSSSSSSTTTSLPVTTNTTTMGPVETTKPSIIDSTSLPSSNSSSSSANFSCTRNQFHCGDGQCISNVFQCDYDLDCENGKDEEDCHLMEPTCSPYFWKCGNGQCVYRRFLCDGDFDCTDGTDEMNCELNDEALSREAYSGGNYPETVDANEVRRRRRRRRNRHRGRTRG